MSRYTPRYISGLAKGVTRRIDSIPEAHSRGTAQKKRRKRERQRRSS